MELKFRAWDRVTGEFIYSDQVAGGTWRFFKLLEDRGIRHYEAEHYIGISDINKKELYEGDVVRTKYGYKGAQELVIQGISECGIFFARVYGGGGYFWHNLPQRNTIEHIGDIHNNPDYLRYTI